MEKNYSRRLRLLFYHLGICLVLISCTDPTQRFRSNIWFEGFQDHNQNHKHGRKVTFEEISLAVNRTNVLQIDSPYFLINKAEEPFNSINENFSKIDGIYFGISKKKSNVITSLDTHSLFLALITINFVQDQANQHIYTAQSKYFRNQDLKVIYFKCTNRDLGKWEKIDENDNEIIELKSNVGDRSGYFIGKENLKNLVFKNRQKMYFYFGINSDADIPPTNFFTHIIALDKPYFTNNNLLNENLKKNKKAKKGLQKPIFFSTIGLKTGNQFRTDVQFSNHGGIRPCPEFCPQ